MSRGQVFQEYPVHDQAIKWSHLLGYYPFPHALFKFPRPAMADGYCRQSESMPYTDPQLTGQLEVPSHYPSLPVLPAESTGAVQPAVSPGHHHEIGHWSETPYAESLPAMSKPFSL